MIYEENPPKSGTRFARSGADSEREKQDNGEGLGVREPVDCMGRFDMVDGNI